MNWTRLLIRTAASFVVLFLLGYAVPGFSGFTYGNLIGVSFLVALIACFVEMAMHPETSRDRALIVFLTSALVIYFFTMIFVDVRPPVISTLLAAALIALVELILPERPEVRAGEQGGEPSPEQQ